MISCQSPLDALLRCVVTSTYCIHVIGRGGPTWSRDRQMQYLVWWRPSRKTHGQTRSAWPLEPTVTGTTSHSSNLRSKRYIVSIVYVLYSQYCIGNKCSVTNNLLYNYYYLFDYVHLSTHDLCTPQSYSGEHEFVGRGGGGGGGAIQMGENL